MWFVRHIWCLGLNTESEIAYSNTVLTQAKTLCVANFTAPFMNKNSSGDEIANVNFYAVRPEATQIRWNNAK